MDEETNERLRRCVDPKLRAEGYARWLAERAQIHVRMSEHPEPGVFYEVPSRAAEGKKIHPDVISRLKDAPSGGCGVHSVPPTFDVQPMHKVGDTVACKGSSDAWIVVAVRPAERSSRGALEYEITGPKLKKAWCTADEVKPWPSGEAEDLRLGQSLQLKDGRTGVVSELSLKQTANPWDVAIARILIDGASGDDVELVDAKSKFDIIHSALRRFDPNDCVLVCGRLDPRWGRAGFIVDIDDEMVLVRFCEGDRLSWEQHWICHENLVGVRDERLAHRPQPCREAAAGYTADAGPIRQNCDAFLEGVDAGRNAETDTLVIDPTLHMAYCPVQDRQPSEPSLAQRAAELRDRLIHDPSFITIDWTLFR